MAAAMTALGVTSASATENHKTCGQVRIVHSENGGASWSSNGRLKGDRPTDIDVKLQGQVVKGCSYDVSLSSYETEGPSWETSGKQTYLGAVTVTLSKDHKQDSLSVKDWAPKCFGQIDLYGNGTHYNGENGNALPHYPDSMTPTDLISAWNGGKKCEDTTPPGGGDTTSPPATPPTSPPATPPTSPPATPSDSDSATPSESESATATPSSSASSSAPAVDATNSAAPSGTPVAQPVSSTPTLAETGSNSSQTTTFVAAGAALVIVGGGAVVMTRRRRNTNAG